MFDQCTAAALLKCIRRHSIADTAASTGEESDSREVVRISQHDQGGLLQRSLKCFGQFLEHFGLRDQPCIVQEVAETLAEICCSPHATGNAPVLQLHHQEHQFTNPVLDIDIKINPALFFGQHTKRHCRSFGSVSTSQGVLWQYVCSEHRMKGVKMYLQ